MNIREAILKAADHIEANPRLFDYWSTRKPNDCGTPGCALGWVGYFLGSRKIHVCEIAESVTGEHWTVAAPFFYERMNATGVSQWSCNAKECAKGLRLYADRYHPEESLYRPGADIVREMVGVTA